MIAFNNTKVVGILAGLLVGLGGSLLAQGSQTLSVSAFMDIWQAGGYNDGSGAQAPVSISFPAASGQAITFSSVTGTWSCGNGAVPNGPDGANSGNCFDTQVTVFNPTGPFSGLDMTDFSRPLVGMFLEDTLPTSVPPTYRFYSSDSSQGGIRTAFSALSPQVGQVFFIGDGLTGTGAGAIQVYYVPPTATHLYLGYVDSCGNGAPGCYNDNSGTITATFSISTCNYQVTNVKPQVQLADRAWATQGGIMLSWKTRKFINGAEAAAIADSVPPATTVFAAAYADGGMSGCAQAQDCSISLTNYVDLLSRLGITQAVTTTSVCGLARALYLYGPMTVVTGRPTPNLVEASVITGVTGDGTLTGSSVNYVSPATGALGTTPLGTLLLGVETAAAEGWPEFVQFP